MRNGLLAYALFQAWGNTPQQFAEPNGMALLNAVDTWRGEASDASVEIIEEIIGLPTTFSGSGKLPRSPRALHWYHTYEGPRYQVILMDTRTQRFYRSPHDFPGLVVARCHTQAGNCRGPRGRGSNDHHLSYPCAWRGLHRVHSGVESLVRQGELCLRL